ncbi:hypothetical protein [uncultured Alistipes sp.]|uniref:hypothetical protein n=1 Tax=uncultured Alistipes sp. TaxID=538949 RepID=UPI002624289D|nr:hypothetical protein [uncultured Alistipes sp.]
MEDFGSIIWLLVAVGALVFSSNSKARKRAREAAKRAKEFQEEVTGREAWPSWDTPQPPRPEADETTGRPTPWPVVPAAPASPARPPRTPETPRTSDAARGAAPRQTAGKAPEPAPQPTFRSTSEIPDTAAATSAAAAAPGGKQTGRPMTEGELMSKKRQLLASIAARHNGVGDVVQSVKEAHENGTIAPDLATEIREEFDLRRAVLYSEIMKPKFEEDFR